MIEAREPATFDEDCRRVLERAAETFGWELYYEVGSADGERLMGDLADDIGDTYGDLRRGLDVFERSEVDGVW